MAALIDVILPVFLVIGFGYVVVWRGKFPEAGIDALMLFAQAFALPLLLFRSFATLDLAASFDPFLLLSYYTGSLTCFLTGMIGARKLFSRPWEDSVAIGVAAMFPNTLLLGIPITERAYGGGAALAGNFAIIAFHVSFCYLVGIFAMEVARAKGSSALRLAGSVAFGLLKNSLILGAMAGILVNLTGLPIAGPVWEAIDLIVRTALPVALFALGGVLFRYRPEGDVLTIAFICAVNLILHPAIVFTLGSTFGLTVDGLRSAVITAAVAPGVNSYLFANQFGVAKRVCASSLLAGTALSIFTCWVWLAILP